MKGISLILYISIISFNLIMILAVIYTFGLLLPAHILLYWLSFDRILSIKTFHSSWTSLKFAGIAFLSPWFSVLALIICDGVSKFDFRNFTNPIYLVLLAMTILEFFILYFTYARYLKKRSAGV